MPSFLYGVLFLDALSLGLLIYWINARAPDSVANKIIFLTLVYVVLSASLSVILYFLTPERKGVLNTQKSVYRKGLRLSLFAGFVLTGVLFLLAFDLQNVFNFSLFLLLCIAVYPSVAEKHRR